MSAFQEQPIETHNIEIDMGVAQLCKGQDQTYSGVFIDEETHEEGKWAMITDGHGSNTCINFLRSIKQAKLNEIIGTRSPVETMAKYINQNAKIGKYESSGATMCLVKIYKDRIVCINCGDSRVIVYKNNESVFISKEHNSFNMNERRRIEACYPGVKIDKTTNIKIISENKMIGIVGEYIDFPSGTRLMTSQALGHNGNTGYAPDYETIYYDENDSIKIIIGSDGLWEMVLKDNKEEISKLANMHCKDILDFAVKRWLQEWEMYTDINAETFIKCSYNENQCDDVGIVTVDIVPKMLYE
jgi:serine/threonine protein phosphatase PrpC